MDVTADVVARTLVEEGSVLLDRTVVLLEGGVVMLSDVVAADTDEGVVVEPLEIEVGEGVVVGGSVVAEESPVDGVELSMGVVEISVELPAGVEILLMMEEALEGLLIEGDN